LYQFNIFCTSSEKIVPKEKIELQHSHLGLLLVEKILTEHFSINDNVHVPLIPVVVDQLFLKDNKKINKEIATRRTTPYNIDSSCVQPSALLNKKLESGQLYTGYTDQLLILERPKL